mmetsp:Transcript_37643/g.113718  ORF Transcript_37643/g.113718 Transcript_37643/m.113718 type:complete len:296 (+) Transcript_37643:142-1029(+)
MDAAAAAAALARLQRHAHGARGLHKRHLIRRLALVRAVLVDLHRVADRQGLEEAPDVGAVGAGPVLHHMGDLAYGGGRSTTCSRVGQKRTVRGAADAAERETHLVGGQRPSLVAKNEIDLPKLFHDRGVPRLRVLFGLRVAHLLVHLNLHADDQVEDLEGDVQGHRQHRVQNDQILEEHLVERAGLLGPRQPLRRQGEVRAHGEEEGEDAEHAVVEEALQLGGLGRRRERIEARLSVVSHIARKAQNPLRVLQDVPPEPEVEAAQSRKFVVTVTRHTGGTIQVQDARVRRFQLHL